MEDIVKALQDQMGGLDLLVLDWLGGALGRKYASDPAMLRLQLQEAADFMAQAAEKYNMVTVDFAQAHVSLAYDRLRVDQSCLAECKMLGREKTGVLGITGFRQNPNDESSFDKPIFQNEQYFYVSKARKSEGFPIKVRRDFKFQRFQSM
jgi:hypothetical protein